MLQPVGDIELESGGGWEVDVLPDHPEELPEVGLEWS